MQAQADGAAKWCVIAPGDCWRTVRKLIKGPFKTETQKLLTKNQTKKGTFISFLTVGHKLEDGPAVGVGHTLTIVTLLYTKLMVNQFLVV